MLVEKLHGFVTTTIRTIAFVKPPGYFVTRVLSENASTHSSWRMLTKVSLETFVKDER
jgi:hypothetical protein